MEKIRKEIKAFAIFMMDDFYGVFSVDDFDKEGNYKNEYESFNINEIDQKNIVAFNSVEDAERFADFENMGFNF